VSGIDHKMRLLAILAADAAGYARLMAADESATVAALDAARAVFRTQIISTQGRVIDMAGDSVLAVFELATGAVAAALAIQQELNSGLGNAPADRRMQFRIGIHLGEIIEKADGSVYGDGVNIAARLQNLAEPGGITVSDLVRSAVKGKVDVDFDDRGEQTVKNIAEPVRVYGARSVGKVSVKGSSTPGKIDLSLPDKPSIAVLPFTNMSGDPDQEYFTDGVTEDIITELSRFKELFVTARNSTFSYKGKSPDVRTVGKELGVRYVLEGCIRRAGNRIRLTAQLIDSIKGSHIWAERYDRVLEDIFALQEELTESIVGTISSTIVTAEINGLRQRRPSSLSAYEAALRAKALGWEAFRKNDPSLSEQAIREANAALATDPRSVQALCALAQAHWQQFYFKSTSDSDAAWRAGYEAASRAIELDPTNEEGFRRKAQLCLRDDAHLDEAMLNARRACELNPNNASALNYLGLCEVKRGELHGAIEHLTRSMRISPRDPLKPNSALAFAYFLAKDYAAALEQAQIAASETLSSPLPMALIAVSHVGLNELDKATAAVDRVRRIAPNFLDTLSVLMPYRNPEHRSRLTTFIAVACGTEDPAAAEPIR
jgi:adenylate cyclase